MENANPLPARKFFVRLSRVKKPVSDLLREAKRVGYTVENNGGFSYIVRDPTNANAIVFRAVNMGNCWSVSYSTDYWQEPAY